MSLITRCPECQTMFRLVPDQLRLSEGWVRCGQCEAVFDATAHLHDGLAPQIDTPEEAISNDIPQAPLEAHQEPEVGFPEVEDEPQVLLPAAHDMTVSVDADEVRSLSRPASNFDLPADVSFIQQPAKQVKLQSPWARRALVSISLVLCLTLVLQFLLFERDRLAATEPALKPALVGLCDLFQCEVKPLRQIESIVIDSSSFNKVRGDVYRLSLTLKNTSQMMLAAPAIELSLTDMQDQPILRRVFQPAELGNVSNTITPGSESASTLAVSIKSGGSTDRIAGYRVLAFYP